MLYSCMTIAIGALFGLALLWTYRIGLKDGLRVKDTGRVESLDSAKDTPVKPPDNRLDKILNNIDSYNGTPSGQKEV